MNPTPTSPATNAAAKLPARPATDGASPGASEACVLLEALAVVVPFVCALLEVTRAVRLESDAKADLTLLPFLHSEVE